MSENYRPPFASLQIHPHQSEVETKNRCQTHPNLPSLAQLGYEAHLERQESWGEAEIHSLYTIRECRPPGQPPPPIIAQLSAIDNNCVANHGPDPEDAGGSSGVGALLVVHHLATEDDSRHDDPARPRARDLLAAFWAGTLGRSPRRLRALRFEAVVETHTRGVLRDLVCPLLRVPYDRCTDGPRGDFALTGPPPRLVSAQVRAAGATPTRAPDGEAPLGALEEAEAEAWVHLCRGSRLVRLAMGMPLRFDMAAPGEDVEIIRIDVLEGFDKHGNSSAFDLICIFGTAPSRAFMSPRQNTSQVVSKMDTS